MAPNNNYIRGRKKEWDLVKRLRERGFDACRSAGSHSPWDVWGFNAKEKKVVLIQIKSKKGSKKFRQDSLNVFKDCEVLTWWEVWE